MQDEPGAVREAVDPARVGEWMAGGIGGWTGDAPCRWTVRQFPGGHSNLTYLLACGRREWVLRLPPPGNTVKTAHDMAREFQVLSALAPVFPEAPAPAAYCDDPAVLGAPFYLMERRRGLVLRRTLPEGMTLPAPLAGRLSGAVAGVLARLHRLDPAAVGLAGFGRPAGYVQRQLSGWSDRWTASATGPVPDMDAVAAWLPRRAPAETGAAVIHNDLKFDNLLLDPADPARIVAVLDWEMATVGDPLMDLGTSLAYWIEASDPPELVAVAVGPTMAPGMWTRARLAEEYARLSGRPVGDLDFYCAFGLFKVAVIVQQLFARYRRGATADPRFASLDRVVAVLARQAARVAEGGFR